MLQLYNAPIINVINARLPLIWAEGGEKSGMVEELIAKFPRHSGDLSSLKKFIVSTSPCSRWGIVIFSDANPHLSLYQW